jgi:zinc transport system ATP-binding protein
MTHTSAEVPAVRITGVSFAYPGQAPALDGISLEVAQGERLAIIGPNGGGKSTLLKLILGELTPRSGTVEILGLTPAEARRRQLIGYVPQRSLAERGFPLSVRQVVSMAASTGLRPWARLDALRRDAVDRALEVVGLTALADRPVGALSGGQFQRVLLARAMAVDPPILVLDEPTTGLDAAGQEQLAEVLASLQAVDGLTLILVSHDIRAIAAPRKPEGDEAPGSFCDRVACLRRTLHFHASPGGITPQVLAHVFEHDLSRVFGDVKVVAEKGNPPALTPTGSP